MVATTLLRAKLELLMMQAEETHRKLPELVVYLGMMIQFDYFSNGLVQPPTSLGLENLSKMTREQL